MASQESKVPSMLADGVGGRPLDGLTALSSLDQAAFYDRLAEHYDLIYPDWEGSMRRHGAAISAMLGEPQPSATRILDASAGIGTQALPLAAMGYQVVARDLSSAAVRRLEREAEARKVEIDAAPADMREIARSVTGVFDAVIAFDNSIPHLLTDAEIQGTLEQFSQLLAPNGLVLISVRDYESVERAPTSYHDYGERVRGSRRFRLGQEWRWHGTSHYRTTMVIEELASDAWAEVVRAEAAYYAIPLERLLHLMGVAGLAGHRVTEVPFFQPVLRGRAPELHDPRGPPG